MVFISTGGLGTRLFKLLDERLVEDVLTTTGGWFEAVRVASPSNGKVDSTSAGGSSVGASVEEGRAFRVASGRESAALILSDGFIVRSAGAKAPFGLLVNFHRLASANALDLT